MDVYVHEVIKLMPGTHIVFLSACYFVLWLHVQKSE